MKSKSTLIYSIILITGVIIMVNILADKFFLRLDFTADKRYTLSNATKDILHDLAQPITVSAYFSEDLPPDIAKARRDFKDLLIEYGNVSDGMIVYEFINPNKEEKLEQEAMQAGVQPVIINTREKDQSVQKRAYLGAVLQMGEQKEVIPFMQPGAAMEYALSSSIKKLSVNEKPVIGMLQGHGEPKMWSMQQAMKELNVLYKVEHVHLSDTIDNLAKYNTLVIIAPTDTFPQSHLQQLDNFLAQGKKMFIGINRVEGDLRNAMGSEITTRLETWLAGKGINISPNFVIDANCASVTVQQQQGVFSFQSNISFPYLPVAVNFEDHPISGGLEAVLLQFASSINYSGDTTIAFTPIVKSSDQSGTRPAPTYFDIQHEWSENDFPISNLTMGATLTGKIAGNMDSRLVVIADGDFIVNGEGQQAQQLQPDNVSLFVNSIDWLSDDTGLIELRTKGVSARPLDQIDDGKKTFLKYLNFLLPIFLIVIYGIIRIQYRQNLRIKRMEVGYV